MLGLALDLLIIVLLSGVLGFGLMLYRRLRRFHHETASFEHLITALGGATERAEAALGELKRTAAAAGERLAEDHDRAQRLSDDLRLLSGRADQLAERLEEVIRVARPLERPGASPRPAEAGNAGRTPPQPSPAMSPDELERTLRTLR